MKKVKISKNLWDDYKIDSLNVGFDYDEPVSWAVASGMLIERLIVGMNEFKSKKRAERFAAGSWKKGERGSCYCHGPRL